MVLSATQAFENSRPDDLAKVHERQLVASYVRAAAHGDADAWNALVDRFAPMIWSIARGHRLNAADAADVSQVTWLCLHQHIGRLIAPERVGAWLATTARRECLRVLRVGSRQIPIGDGMVDVTDQTAAPPDQGLAETERNVILRASLLQLPPRCQMMLRLLLTADTTLSYTELGELLDMPIGSIGPTRARCLEHLRRLVEAAGVSMDDSVV
jgi:RNA polymerase sigma factor (sigma-70 family)